MLHERHLTRAVALVHAADLRHRHVGLVDDAEHVLGKVVDERERRLAGLAAVQMARVVLDAVAEAHGLEHLEVVAGTLLQALSLEQLVGRLELGHAVLQFLLDRAERVRYLGLLCHIMGRRPHGNGVVLAGDLARHLIDLGDLLHLVAKELKAQRMLGIGRKHVHHIAPHAEAPALQVVVVAVVLDVDERVDEVVALERHLLVHVGREARVVLGAADAVDARDARHHDHVAPREQARRGLVAQHLHLLVDGGVLLDVGVRLRHVGLGLVVVVVRDEVDHGVLGKELAHLGRHLGREGLVGLHDERGLAERLDGLGHGEGLARARHAEQRLVAVARADAGRELLDGLGLVARRLVGAHHMEPRVALGLPKAPELAAHALDLEVLHVLSLHVPARGIVLPRRGTAHAKAFG